jgi:serine protease Do
MYATKNAVHRHRTARPLAVVVQDRAADGTFSRWVTALIVVTAFVLFAWGARAQPVGAPSSFADLAEKLLPAVVNISTTTTVDDSRGPDMPQFPPGSPFEEFFRDFMERQGQQPEGPRRQHKTASLGSGFIVDSSGIVVTNNHVIDGADEITVILQDDTNLKAKLLGRDPRTDLAVLQVETDRKLPSVKFGDSDALRIGDWVVAIGNPFGLGGSVTAGILSARSRNINNESLVDFLQTDAAINRGNSGGPLFNLRGEVVGINTAIFSPSGGSVGIGFSVPSNIASNVVAQLREFGRTRRGWLGVRIQEVTPEIAESLGLDRARGALVAAATPDGPAEKAGIMGGDVVLKFDGKDIPEMRRLPRTVAETRIGAVVPVEVWRDGKTVGLKVTLGDLEEAQDTGLLADSAGEGKEEPEQSGAVVLGMTLAPLDEKLKQQFGIGADVQGVVVSEVAPDSDAFTKGLRAGDVIKEVNREPVATVQAFRDRLRAAREQGRKSILVLTDRKGDLRFVAISTGG